MQTAESYFTAGKSTVTFDTYRVGEMDVVTREDAMRIGRSPPRRQKQMFTEVSGTCCSPRS